MQAFRVRFERRRERVETGLDLRRVEVEQRSRASAHERIRRVVRCSARPRALDVLITTRAAPSPPARRSSSPTQVTRRLDRLQPVHEDGAGLERSASEM